MNRLLLLATSCILLFTSCHNMFGKRIHGNGVIKTEGRKTGDFSSIDVGGAINVYLKQGADRSVSIETDENLFEYIETSDDGDVLRIRPRRNINLDPSGTVKVYVTAPAFTRLHVSGASKIISDSRITSEKEMDIDISGASEVRVDIKAPRITAELSGASNMVLTGETKDFSVGGSGASNARCFELLTENANVDLSGASGADVFASVSIHGEASGASHIRYKGNATVQSNTSGAGSIKKVD